VSERVAELIDAARAGSRVALARLITLVESGGDPQREIAAVAYRERAPYVLGITGSPGAGKSTLADKLIAPSFQVGDAGKALTQIAVLAIDPTSPFSGGAILGDRIRMQDHASDDRVFIRSMATRGHLGGLSLAVPDSLRVLATVGFAAVIVETVGVGQMEVEIASTADTIVVVTNPGWGDSMQANKAGLTEIADIFVINKADRAGVRETRRDLEQMLDLGAERPWRPPILDTVATSNTGIDALWVAVNEHREHLESTSELGERRRAHARAQFDRVLSVSSLARTLDIAAGRDYERLLSEFVEQQIDPYSAADALLGQR
jgi:LAO/AO transport system kinase